MRSDTIMRGETIMRRAAMMMMVGGLVPACEQLKPIDGGSDACVPAEVQAAFDRSCGPGCHTGGAAGGGLALDAGQSAAAIGAPAAGSPLPQIELGNTAGSYLAQKIMDNPTAAITGTRMPQGYSPSNTTQVEDINTILTWIGGGVFECAGADTGGTAESGSGSTDTGSTLRSCGLEDLSPGAANPIVSGTDPMQIPPDIATILTENCGCHYTNDYATPPPYIDYNEEQLPLDIATWAGFQETNAGGTPFHAVTLARVMGGPPIAMPPGDPHCVEMNAADTATLVDWLTAEAPDCTTWTGAGCTGEMIQACGIEDIKPGAPNPIDAGSGAGQIPTDIGTILAGNCGCHYVDMPTADVSDYQGTQDIATLAGFQAPYNVAGDPLRELTLMYLMSDSMPLAASCDIGGGEAMPPADRALLVQWLTEGTPDGATWMP